MGCKVTKEDDYIEVEGRPLKAIRAEMTKYPDIVTPLAVTAAFADGVSEFYGISHLKSKESDRLKDPITELRKMGINAWSTKDSIFVEGGEPYGAEIDTHGDHRIAMAFAPPGLVVEDGVIVINNKDVVGKSNLIFWDQFSSLYQ